MFLQSIVYLKQLAMNFLEKPVWLKYLNII